MSETPLLVLLFRQRGFVLLDTRLDTTEAPRTNEQRQNE